MIRNFYGPTRCLAGLAAAAAIAACGREPSAGSRSGTHSAYGALGERADTAVTLRGAVASMSAMNMVVRVDTGRVTVKLTQPFKVYDRETAKLADVKDNSFIGVTTVKQPDGSEKATEIHIFPEELRGMGEGSRMMTTQHPMGGGSRMTNGAVSGSRMSNGNVAGIKDSTLLVQYPGGSLKVTVPPNTPVTVLTPTSKPLSTGEQVVVVATRAADGSLSSGQAILARK